MSEPILREKKQMLIKLAVLGVIIVTAAVFVLSGVDLKALLDQGIELVRETGPVSFFVALALLPAVGVPLTVFTLPAGSVFAGDAPGAAVGLREYRGKPCDLLLAFASPLSAVVDQVVDLAGL